MTDVRVTPETFTLVNFDAGRIAELTSKLAGEVGLPDDAVVEIEVDEKTPAARVRTESIDPIRLKIDGGAIEETTAPRTLSDRLVADVIGRLLFRAADRRTPAFADAPTDEELDLAQQTAWDSYSMGRLERLGYDVRKPRRLYHFRNRHGFHDVADQAFGRLWTADSLTWSDIEAICAETAEARAALTA